MRFIPNDKKPASAKTLLRLTAAALIGLSTIQTPVFAQSFSVGNIAVQGNQRIQTGTIIDYLELPASGAVSAGDINDAAQRLRATGLFESVDVVTQGGGLVIQVVERPTVYRINIEGNRRLSDDELFGLVSATERRIYNADDVAADAQRMAEAYANDGRINAVVTPRIIRLPDNRVNVVYEVEESGVTEIERIAFTGNNSFSDRRLRGVLETKQAGILRALIGRDTYVADRVEFDKRVLTDFYQSRGYVDFQILDTDVTLARERDAYLMTFSIEEGQQFDFGNITVTSDLPEVDVASFQEVVRTRSGSTYTPLDVENDIARIEELAVRQGLQFVQVEPVVTRDDRGLLINVDFQLKRGPRIFVERIDIEGNNTTLDRVVRQQFRVVEGDPFNPRSIRQSAERIRALGFFSNAEVNARQGSSEDQVVIDVNVTEQPTGSLSFGANYNTDNGVSLLASFRQANFLGRGQALNVSISTAKTNNYLTLNFSEPYLLGRDVEFDFDFSYRATNRESADYDTTRFNFQPGLTFNVSDRGRLNTYVLSNYAEIRDANADEVSPYVLADEGGVWTSGVGYNYSWSSARDGLNEKTTYSFRVGQEFGFGDANYIETTARASAETKVLNEDLTLRATIEGGLLHYSEGDSRIIDRFNLSSRQMRGFEQYGLGPRYYDDSDPDNVINDALGGEAYAVARLEAEFPLGLPEEYGISGGAFYDYGSLWDPGFDCDSDPNVYYCDFTPRSVAGLSMFWDTPIGPLRFDFTEALQTEELDQTKSFDVSISTRF